MNEKSLQDLYSPRGTCYGCGPANPDGLQIKSFIDGDQVVAQWQPQEKHNAAPGMLNGGIICALLDCHSNWAGIARYIQEQNLDAAPSTVTASFEVKFLAPTPIGDVVMLQAKTTKIEGKKIFVEGQLLSGKTICAKCTGLFVAVSKDHPAYHRWEPS